MDHELATACLIGPDKIRCGDHVGVDELDGGATVALCVCDGVGSHSHDWLASQTACQTVSAVLTDVGGDLDARLVAAVEAAHSAVQELSGPAAGASTTLVLVCWTVGDDRVRCISIGDSRLYRVTPAVITAVTDDDAASVPVHIGGQLALSAGSVAFARGLTRAVGHGILGEVTIEQVPFLEGEMLAATSDGFHEIPGFLRALEAVYAAADLDGAIATDLGSLHAASGRDDATIATVRRCGVSTALRDRCRAALSDETAAVDPDEVAVHVLRRVLIDLVAAGLTAGKPADADQTLDLLDRCAVQLTRDQVAGLLDAVRDDGTAATNRVYQRLVKLAGRGR